LHLASDSRISFGAGGAADVGVKVMRLRIRVRGVDLEDEGDTTILFNKVYGFCYAGSFVNAGTFKELIGELLDGVQYVAEPESLSFEEICNFVAHYCGKVSTEVISRMAEKGRYTFFLTGYCPMKKTLRGARFNLSQSNGTTSVSFDVVAEHDSDYVAVGTGQAEFDALFSGKSASLSGVLLTLNRVIDEAKVDSVGGDIQYGTFDSSANFYVAGIQRISMEEADDDGKHYGPSQQRTIKYRGFDIYHGWTMDSKFFPVPTFYELTVPSNDDSERRFIELCRKKLAAPNNSNGN
jgi:hypothetical protein